MSAKLEKQSSIASPLRTILNYFFAHEWVVMNWFVLQQSQVVLALSLDSVKTLEFCLITNELYKGVATGRETCEY